MTNAAVVPMFDASDSMRADMAITKICCKAFIRHAFPGDQFAIIKFTDTSIIAYPPNQQLVTVSPPPMPETAEAATVIEGFTTGLMTDIGDAYTQASNLLATATLPTRAAVLLSDGEANRGPLPPDPCLSATYPIYICGLGYYLQKSNFTAALLKNTNSKYYPARNAYNMQQVWNDIRALPPGAASLANSLASYSGSDYAMTPATVAEGAAQAQFSVVWTDPSYQYTAGNPGPGLINIVLIDPTGATSTTQPVIVDKGYAIFNLQNPQPGVWNVLAQYSVSASMWGTSGGFDFGTGISLEVEAPQMVRVNEPINLTAKMVDGDKPVENLRVNAHIESPILSVDNALIEYKSELDKISPSPQHLEQGMHEDLAKLATLHRAKLPLIDILPDRKAALPLTQNDQGHYAGIVADTTQAGGYKVRVDVSGYSPITKRTFSRTKLLGVIVH